MTVKCFRDVVRGPQIQELQSLSRNADVDNLSEFACCVSRVDGGDRHD